MDCIFCKIAEGTIPAKKAHEDDLTVAFHDVNPQAPTHLLIIPRRHVAMHSDLAGGPGDDAVLGRMHAVARLLAAQLGLEHGYRLVLNSGRDGGQTVFHLHMHLLGGRAMAWPPG